MNIKDDKMQVLQEPNTLQHSSANFFLKYPSHQNQIGVYHFEEAWQIGSSFFCYKFLWS